MERDAAYVMRTADLSIIAWWWGWTIAVSIIDRLCPHIFTPLAISGMISLAAIGIAATAVHSSLMREFTRKECLRLLYDGAFFPVIRLVVAAADALWTFAWVGGSTILIGVSVGEVL